MFKEKASTSSPKGKVSVSIDQNILDHILKTGISTSQFLNNAAQEKMMGSINSSILEKIASRLELIEIRAERIERGNLKELRRLSRSLMVIKHFQKAVNRSGRYLFSIALGGKPETKEELTNLRNEVKASCDQDYSNALSAAKAELAQGDNDGL